MVRLPSVPRLGGCQGAGFRLEFDAAAADEVGRRLNADSCDYKVTRQAAAVIEHDCLHGAAAFEGYG
jgi:hypothetical protein